MDCGSRTVVSRDLKEDPTKDGILPKTGNMISQSGEDRYGQRDVGIKKEQASSGRLHKEKRWEKDTENFLKEKSS